MKNKKGFTLVELLAVIVIVCLITSIGTAGVIGVKQLINNELWKNTVSLVENGAIHFGEDHSYLFVDGNVCPSDSDDNLSCLERCTIDGVSYNCLNVSVNSLIDRGYLFTKEKITDEGVTKKVLVNNTKKKGDTCYYINEYDVYIYEDNDLFYAKLDQNSCPKEGE